MNDKVTPFPQYRMLSNGKSFYKITDDRNFEEIQIFGSKSIRHKIAAEQYPEMLKIQDMLRGHEGFYVEIPEEKWIQVESGL